MIDDKKIEEEATNYAQDGYNNYDDNIQRIIEEAFKSGATWMQEKFLKELWHPASEKPLLRNGKCLVVYNSGKIDIFKISFVYEMLSNYGKDGMGWKCWCYISDLFPKEGGNHD